MFLQVLVFLQNAFYIRSFLSYWSSVVGKQTPKPRRTVRFQIERMQRSSDGMIAMVHGEETEKGTLDSIHGGGARSIEEAVASRDHLVDREPNEVELSLGGVIENTRMMGSIM